MHDLTNQKTITETMTKTKTNTNTETMTETCVKLFTFQTVENLTSGQSFGPDN